MIINYTLIYFFFKETYDCVQSPLEFIHSYIGSDNIIYSPGLDSISSTSEK